MDTRPGRHFTHEDTPFILNLRLLENSEEQEKSTMLSPSANTWVTSGFHLPQSFTRKSLLHVCPGAISIQSSFTYIYADERITASAPPANIPSPLLIKTQNKNGNFSLVRNPRGERQERAAERLFLNVCSSERVTAFVSIL